MPDLIHLLSDTVANQIAAGEVIQRPASVVKELVENAVDAGAASITVRIKDAGKTLVQVIDNGQGMTESDARMCFERHATSKISDAADLFAIRTMGFRGEALASIASIAEVTLKTRRPDEELGTVVHIAGSRIQSQEADATPVGTNIMVKNLFFNVPARRKFLKSDNTELRHIITEFTHVALACPEIEFILIHNNTEIFRLAQGNRRNRIIGLFGKSINQVLIPVETDTTLVKISGFICKPEYAKKTYGEQFFFVNNRFMKHPYFQKAVVQAYEEILPADHLPSFFIFMDSDPSRIDINIHPTKTEIKFEDERSIWHILAAAVKEAIGRHNLSPAIDFITSGVIDIPVLRSDTEIRTPLIDTNPDYNPFREEQEQEYRNQGRRITPDVELWEKLYERNTGDTVSSGMGFEDNGLFQATSAPKYLQVKNKYILTPVKSGVMWIDQRRAHERILFEQHLESVRRNSSIAQQSLFPETLTLSSTDYLVCQEIIPELGKLGFDIRDFGNNTIIVDGAPSNLETADIRGVIEELIEQYKSLQGNLSVGLPERVARSMAVACAIPYGKVLQQEEMQKIVDQLFACTNPNFTPSGKPVVTIVKIEDIEKLFNA